MLLAQEASESPGPATRLLEETTGSEFLAGLVGPLIEIAVILVLAIVATLFARRLVRRAVEEMKHPERVRRGLSAVGRRTRIRLLQGVPLNSERRRQRADALGALFKSMASVTIWTIAVFLVLGTVGINLGPLIASAGIVGVAIGFGAQDLVKDFISGVFMLVEDQYGVGDIIDVGEAAGVVEGVGLRSTRIRDVEGVLWHVPNGEIRRVGNKSQDWSRVVLDVQVAYDADVDRASEVIETTAQALRGDDTYGPLILEPPELWGVEVLGDWAVSIRLVAKVAPGEQWKVAREMRRRVKKALDAAGIEIPFPQQALWMRGMGTRGTEQERTGDG